MFSFKASSVSEALCTGIHHLLHEGVSESSRAGNVLVAPGPVLIEYTAPWNRVLYSATRDANPAFHFFESLWMLHGDNRCDFPRYFNGSYSQFSDDGGATMWDAYGWRWKIFFGWDQLDGIVEELKTNPTSRRCVLSMWNSSRHHASMDCSEAPEWLREDGWAAYDDFAVATHGGKAVPCNTHAYFAIRNGALNLTVCNRSNDLIWGCAGANAVHFSFLLEYVAARVSVPVGSYFQFTNNLHAYTDRFDRTKLKLIADECEIAPVEPAGPNIAETGFDEDLKTFMPWARSSMTSDEALFNPPMLNTQFMYGVVMPMFLFWAYRKRGQPYKNHLERIMAPDWRRACSEWSERRMK